MKTSKKLSAKKVEVQKPIKPSTSVISLPQSKGFGQSFSRFSKTPGKVTPQVKFNPGQFKTQHKG